MGTKIRLIMMGFFVAGSNASAQLDSQQSKPLQAESMVRRIVSEMSPEARVATSKNLRDKLFLIEEKTKLIRQHFTSALASGDVASVSALSNTSDKLESNRTAAVEVKQLLDGTSEKLTLPDRSLEQLIKATNPALPTCGATVSWRGKYVDWQNTIDRYTSKYSWMASAVGRVEQLSTKWRTVGGKIQKTFLVEPIGTAFLVNPTQLITAFHVIQNRYSEADGLIPSDRSIQINFGAEYKCPDTDKASVVTVRKVPLSGIDQARDIAILEIDKITDRTPLKLVKTSVYPSAETIFVLGYPGRDPNADRDDLITALKVNDANDVLFDVKRFEPGGISNECPTVRNFEIGHDATTFGNSSGGPVIRIIDGSVIGIQSAGIAGTCNFATRSDYAIALLELLENRR